MKRRIRFGFSDMWGGHHPDRCAILRLLRTRFDIQLCSRPDFLLYSVFGGEFSRHRGIRIFFAGENERPNWDECDFAFTFDHTDHPDHFRWPLFGIYGDCRRLVKQGDSAAALLAAKTKFCNFVYSNPRCEQRNRFYELLSKYKPIDAGGKLFNNVGGRIRDKLEFIAAYKFTIAFENASHPGYTTEKIAEPMWAGSLPIYWGNPLIHQDFNPRGFINYFDYGSLEALVERVIEVDRNDELYLEYLRQPWFPQNQIPPQVSDEKILAQFERIFATTRTPIALRAPQAAIIRRPTFPPWRPLRKLRKYLAFWQRRSEDSF